MAADPPSHISQHIRFDSSKYVVATNDLRKWLDYERLASFSPVIRIDDCDADVDGERTDHDDT